MNACYESKGIHTYTSFAEHFQHYDQRLFKEKVLLSDKMIKIAF